MREGTKLGEKESLRVCERERGDHHSVRAWRDRGSRLHRERGTERPNVPTFDTKLHQTSFPQALLHSVHGVVKKAMQFLYTPASPSSLLLL